MGYDENKVLEDTSASFIQDDNKLITMDANKFLANVKEHNLLPFDDLSIHYNDDFWDFEGITKANLDTSNFRFDFSRTDVRFRDELKGYVLISIVEGRLSLAIINRHFRAITKFLDFCAEKGASTVADIQALYAVEWISKADTTGSERYKYLRGGAVLAFYTYYNVYIQDIFGKNHFDTLRNSFDKQLLKAEFENNKTPNIPDDYFDQIVAAAIHTIDDEEAHPFYRALSCMLLMESQVGLRTGELFALKVGCVHPVTISTGDTAYFLEYETWKKHRGICAISKEITYVNELFKKGYDSIVQISDDTRREKNVDYLFVESLNESRMRFPVTPNKGASLMKSLFKYYNKYFPTIFECPPSRYEVIMFKNGR